KIVQALQAEVAREVARLVSRVLADRQRLGYLDLEASEMAIRASMHQMGGAVLEKLLNADGGGYRGARIDCGQGHQAKFVEYRGKEVITVLSPVEVLRAYYHCASCEGGVIPKDQELDIVGTSFSPGVRRMMGRVGGKEPFEEGRGDLEELAGVLVKTKQVERVSEDIGKQMETIAQHECELAMSGKVVLLKAVPKLYIAMDGTGVPMVPHETEGRQGKDETGKAKTREAKLGCVFTQTRLDDKGYPVRDEESTTYVGAIETAEAFGPRIYTEAVRRGVTRAETVIVLGDGAPWIWGIADEHFHGAIQIVDLYHAREHLANLGKLVYGPASAEAKEWARTCVTQLDAGEVEGVVASMRRLRPREEKAQEEVRKAIEYFQTNAERMRYARFRSQGLFVGSGVVEAGCKTIVGQRLKQSGMRWTVRGANAIIALRCCQLSGRWEEFWEARSVG
ncbi:MAG: ISKra4 family transposase, partial [Thermoplasmata archaeon]